MRRASHRTPYLGRVTGLMLLGGWLLAAPAAAQGQVAVRFAEPERFTDAENRYGSGQTLRVTLAELTRILEDLGRTRLRPDESLDVTILDVDLAGFERPGFGAQGLRVVTDVTPPRIRLAYRLRRAGRVVAQGEDVATDLNFLIAPRARLSAGGLAYEREVLRDWFARRFGDRRDPG